MFEHGRVGRTKSIGDVIMGKAVFRLEILDDSFENDLNIIDMNERIQCEAIEESVLLHYILSCKEKLTEKTPYFVRVVRIATDELAIVVRFIIEGEKVIFNP